MLSFGSKVRLSDFEGSYEWLDSKLIKDVIYKDSKMTDRAMYEKSYWYTRKDLFETSVFEVASIIKFNERSYYLLKDSFNHAITIDVTLYKKDLYTEECRYMKRSSSKLKTLREYEVNIYKNQMNLKTGLNTYKTIRHEEDSDDKEKALMLLLLKSKGVDYSDIKYILENNVKDWEKIDKLIEKPKSVKKAKPKQEEKEIEYFLKIIRNDTYTFTINKVTKQNYKMSDNLIYINYKSPIFDELKTIINKMKNHKQTTYTNEPYNSLRLNGTKTSSRHLITMYNKLVEESKLDKTKFEFNTFPNQTSLKLFLCKIKKRTLIVSTDSKKGRNVSRSAVPISKQEAEYFWNDSKSKGIAQMDESHFAHSYWNQFLNDRYKQLLKEFLNS